MIGIIAWLVKSMHKGDVNPTKGIMQSFIEVEALKQYYSERDKKMRGDMNEL